VIPGRTLLAIGARGELVRSIQRELTRTGCSLPDDGIYGDATCHAVKSFQSANSLPVTGVLEEATWTALIRRPVPPVGERSLYLTAAFEGHGFDLAVGNFDGALLTWGIVGFTMKSGEVQKIVCAINDAHPDLVEQAFGAQRDELLQLMSSPPDFQQNWARAHTLANGALAEPWRTLFADLGQMPEVQAEQIREVTATYLTPAIRTARKMQFATELGLALCFDIHVQNGSVSADARSLFKKQVRDGMPELDRRKLLANAVADAAGKWADDVRARKLTLATGEGVVHGHHYVLENWGLSGEIAATELTEAATA
jgi:Putative peptidoglycan binding domain